MLPVIRFDEKSGNIGKGMDGKGMAAFPCLLFLC